MLRTIPTLGIVVILNIAVLVGLNSIYNNILSFSPDQDEIDYIRMSGNINEIYTLRNYLDYKCNDIKITDPEVLATISDNLKSDIQDIKDDKYYEHEYYEKKYIAISVNGVERYRYIKFDKQEFEALGASLINTEEYSKIYKTLPEALNIYGLSHVDANNIDTEKFYNVYRSEVARTDFDTWYNLITREYHGGETVQVLDNIYISISEGMDVIEFDVPIFNELPDTAKAYIEMVYDNEKATKMMDIMTDISKISSIEFCLKNVEGGFDYLYFSEDEFEENNDVITELINSCELIEEYNKNDILIQVYIWVKNEDDIDERKNSYSEEVYQSYFKYNGTEEDIKRILELYYN